MDDVQKLISYLPQLLIYFVPGYVAVISFKFFRGNVEDEEDKISIIYSIVISYILINLYGSIFNISIESFVTPGLSKHVVFLSIIAIIGSYILCWIFSLPIVQNVLYKMGVHIGVQLDILDEIFDDKEGLWIYLYLEEVTYLGKLVKYENIQDNNRDTYVVISNYTSFDSKSSQKIKRCVQENDQLALINLKNVKRVEMVYPYGSEVLKRLVK